MQYEKNEFKAMIEHYRQEMMSMVDKSAPPPSEPMSVTDGTSSAEATSNETEANETDDAVDIGQLQVRVSTENQASPIPNAVVIITKQNSNHTELIRSLITDENGKTVTIDLPTKDRRLSLSPGNDTPYSVYTVDVSAEGYFSKRFLDLPIYGGVLAVQNVSMIPLPENGDNDIVLSYPESAPSL